jgi:predicted RNase H-like HicB family nuclease
VKTKTYTFTAVVNQRGDHYYAYATEVPTMGTHGNDVEEAVGNLREQVAEYLAENPLPENSIAPRVVKVDFVAVNPDGTTHTYTHDVILYMEDDWYLVDCPEVGVADQGETVDEALAMLKEGVELLLDGDPHPNYGKPTLIDFKVEVPKSEPTHA